MKNRSPVTALLAGLLGAVGGLTVAACSNDATGVVPDGSAVDATPDRAAPTDAGKDVNRMDVFVVPDTGLHDTGLDVDTGIDAGDSGFDGGMEASMHDTGPDSPVDAHQDAPDVLDAPLDVMLPDVGTDAGPPAVAFLASVTHSYCQNVAKCCVGDASADFNTAKCQSDAVDGKYVPLTNLGIMYEGLGSPHQTFVPANAAACLAAIDSLSCAVNSATELAAIVSLCASAYTPLLAEGQSGCLSSFDCAPNTYCAPIHLDEAGISKPPAGGGTCMPLVALNAPCADDYNSSDCSYQSGGTPTPAFCAPAVDGGAPACQPSQANGADCSQTFSGQECASGQCQPSGATAYTCQPSAILTVLFGQNLCALYSVHPG